uniref:Uncharacterized protein n=1 Tax=Caenorhabditis japonica TaxID=281687 RepID=A0A8R1I336_CAEJA
MKVVSLALFLILSVTLLEGLTLIIKKNRKYNDPPFCFAYTRDYNDEDVASSCSGYQFDCFDSDGAQIGSSIKFNLKDCETMATFRAYSEADFQKRLEDAQKYASTAEASGN